MRAMLSVHREALLEVLGDEQYGMGEKAAIEKMFRFIESATYEHPENIALAVDMVNAFNSMDRKRILDQVAERYPMLLDIASLVLSNTQQHVFDDDTGRAHHVEATRGVDQGDPMSAVLFMIGMAAVVRAVKTHTTPGDEDKMSFAQYIDDWFIVLRARLTPALLDSIDEELRKVGMQLNRGKTKLWQAPPLSLIHI